MFVENIIAAVFQHNDKLVNWDSRIFEFDEKLFYRTLQSKRVMAELRAVWALMYCTLTVYYKKSELMLIRRATASV